ncbi:MAG TPA: L-idonate 5-dehydrogenase [Thermohalobaculum sp.]|nr:L-idonate 5-dehydrogenase [Thermohalobaculum sp.]
MKAIVIHAAGDLRIEDRDIGALGPGEVEVRIKAGGICGSDLHYFNHGGFGAIRLVDPMILGHEVAGVIAAIGQDVRDISVGDHVAVNPSRPCGTCRFCQQGMQNHCLGMRFYGSAMRRPHIDGAFRQTLVADAAQCIVVRPDLSLNEAAFAEPLAVVLHGLGKAGSLIGKRVLVTGCGPIGNLVILAARLSGAAEIVATDIVDEALVVAASAGADRAINIASRADALDVFAQNKGTFDVMFEASGNEAALRSGLNIVRPEGTIVQLGLGGDVLIPLNTIVAKEIVLKGTFRFHEMFAVAAAMIESRRIDVRQLLTDVLPISEAVSGFKLASDRKQAMKVQIDFSA